jgi:hypothetical protein
MGNIRQFNFSLKTQEALKYYVYMLVDPRDKTIFYVGKGQGNRAFDHARDALKEPDKTKEKNEKLDTIRSIIAQGKEVIIYIVRHGLTDESTAFEIESTLIDFITSFNHKARLRNIQKGHGQEKRGIETAEEIELLYSASELDLKKLGTLGKKIVFIKINKTHGKLDLYTATRICWPVSIPRANKADYIVSVYHGLIVAIFKADKKGWKPYEKEPGRNYFDGYEVTEPFKNLEDENIYNILFGKILPDYARKQQNPFGYIPKDVKYWR